jgi:hypothetical protein
MKTLKVALLVTTAAGAVAAGGVTYATVGNSSPAPSAQAAKDATSGKLPVKVPAAPAVPNAPGVPNVPTCLPNLPKGAALDEAKTKISQEIKALAAKAPQTPVALPGVAGGKLPVVTDKVPAVTDKLPKLPAGKLSKLPKVPSIATASQLAELPVGKLPTCNAGEEKSATAAAPAAPGLPNLPLPTGADCSKVPAVIKNEQARAKQLNLPNGMTLGASHAHKIVIQSRAACEYTQELAGSAPGLLTVDRIQTPPQVTLAEVAQGLRMPGDFASVDGVNTFQTPLHDGMLFWSSKGYAIRVTGNNPATAALLPGIASQLRAQ